jgi:hypothetical protein
LESNVIPSLREKLSMHYVRRLRHHVCTLLSILKKFGGDSSVAAKLSEQCRGFQRSEISPPQVVEAINYLASREDFVSGIRGSCTTKASMQIFREMVYIRRPWIVCDAICKAALDIESFQSIRFQLLDGYEGRSVAPHRPILNPPIKKVLSDCLKKPKFVHAEVRMVTHLLHHGLTSNAFNYLGISKKTCLLCGHVIHSLGDFRTRGNHGKVYSGWTFPHTLRLDKEDISRWTQCVRTLHDILVSQASRIDLVHLDEVKESTVTTPVTQRVVRSNIFTKCIPDPRLQEREATWLSSRSVRKLPEWVFIIASGCQGSC